MATPIHRKWIANNHWVADALAATERRLVDAGLLLSEAQRRRIRGTGWWMLAVAGLGLLRLLAGIANARPVGWLVVAFIAVTIVAVILLASAPRRTQRGDRTLAALRDEHHTLAPRNAPTGRCTGRWGPRWGSASSGCRRCGRRTRRSRASSRCSG